MSTCSQFPPSPQEKIAGNSQSSREKPASPGGAFNLSPRGWLDATRHLTLEERGAYFDMICLAAQGEGSSANSSKFVGHKLHISPRKASALRESLGRTLGTLEPDFVVPASKESRSRTVKALEVYARASIPLATRRAVYERDGYRCRKCASDRRLSLDHIIPVTSGGDNSIENLQTLCLPCNIKKGAKNGGCA